VLDALVAEARLRWGLDLAAGLQVVAAEHLAGTPLEPSRPALIVPAALLRIRPDATADLEPDVEPGPADGAAPAAGMSSQPPRRPEALPGRHRSRAVEPLVILCRLYPADHPVGRFGAADGAFIGTLTEAALATPLFLGAVAPQLAVASPWAMPWLSWRLRLPDGCPWDREQTHESLRSHLLEEAYEVYDALAGGSTPALADELGDLLLQVVLHAQLAAEAGVFDLTDVHAAIATKIVRRHPHVFGDAEARTAGDVNRQWERIKAGERAKAEPEPGQLLDTPVARTRPPGRRAPSTASVGSSRRWPQARRCRSGRPTSATNGPRSRASSTRSTRRSPSSAPLRRRPSRPRSLATSCSSW